MTNDDKTKVVNASLLSDDEKAKIADQVEKELAADAKKKLASDYKASLVAAAKKKALFENAKEGENEDGLVPVFVDLPPVAECIRLDGRQYDPGKTYYVTEAVRAVILEVMGRGREHEESLMDKEQKKNAYRKRGAYTFNNK